jgi:tetratricopeptide (TPR) repeat protein
VRTRRLILLLALCSLATSCAYYNTFYLARKSYFKGTNGLPYLVDKPPAAAGQDFTKAIDLSKKVLANYPKSKWVDDAYLLWARSLLGREDPRETVNMLQDFAGRFPESKLRTEALFYLGVGYRQSHREGEAEATLGRFLTLEPKSELAPYAWLERARALTSLDRDSAAAYCAGRVLERFPRSKLGPRALAARADALLQSGEYARARTDYQMLGLNARDDEERLGFLLREADCLEAARDYTTVIALLKDALGHERPPVVVELAETATSAAGASGSPGTSVAPYQPTPGGDRYGRILMRIGTAHLMAERQQDALDAYQEVVRLYPRSPLSAEAQYRVGYTFETVGDDFERARSEYARVKDEFANSAFATQARSRLTNLDRVMQFHTAGGDTLQKRAEAGFMLAELYLFQLAKPERALEEYQKVATQFTGTPWAAKALTGAAWVLSRRLARAAEADSLLWVVVREYPATESQLAARDYLEQAGITVPDSLIKLPKAPLPPPVDTTRLTPPPAGSMPLGSVALVDSLRSSGPGGTGPRRPFLRRGFQRVTGNAGPLWDPHYAGTASAAPSVAGESPFLGAAGADSVPADSLGAPATLPQPPPGAAADSLPARPVGSPRDSVRTRLER